VATVVGLGTFGVAAGNGWGHAIDMAVDSKSPMPSGTVILLVKGSGVAAWDGDCPLVTEWSQYPARAAPSGGLKMGKPWLAGCCSINCIGRWMLRLSPGTDS
jgi:hypothetical protein